MALQNSGAIKISEIRDEFGLSNPIKVSTARDAAGLPGVSVKFSDFYGLSSFLEGVLQSELVASDAEEFDQFGKSVSVSGDGNTAIVGASFTDEPASGAGSVYVFTRSGDTWSQKFKIVASDGQQNDFFGESVDISDDGNYAIIGATGDDDRSQRSGAVYVFKRSGETWNQQTKLTPSGNTEAIVGLSSSISADGSTVLFSAHGVNVAYVFTRSGSTWSQQAELRGNDTISGDFFGLTCSISADGNTALIGGGGNDDRGSNSGSAYVFVRNGTSWSQQVKLIGNDTAAGDTFGRLVALSADGKNAVITAIRDTPRGTESGSAYIFTRSGNTWSQQAKLTASDGAAGDFFGSECSMSGNGDIAVLTAVRTTVQGKDDVGSAYVFKREGTSWSQEIKLIPPNPETQDEYGRGVSISADGSTLIVSSALDSDVARFAGKAYVYI